MNSTSLATEIAHWLLGQSSPINFDLPDILEEPEFEVKVDQNGKGFNLVKRSNNESFHWDGGKYNIVGRYLKKSDAEEQKNLRPILRLPKPIYRLERDTNTLELQKETQGYVADEDAQEISRDIFKFIDESVVAKETYEKAENLSEHAILNTILANDLKAETVLKFAKKGVPVVYIYLDPYRFFGRFQMAGALVHEIMHYYQYGFLKFNIETSAPYMKLEEFLVLFLQIEYEAYELEAKFMNETIKNFPNRFNDAFNWKKKDLSKNQGSPLFDFLVLDEDELNIDFNKNVAQTAVVKSYYNQFMNNYQNFGGGTRVNKKDKRIDQWRKNIPESGKPPSAAWESLKPIKRQWLDLIALADNL